MIIFSSVFMLESSLYCFARRWLVTFWVKLQSDFFKVGRKCGRTRKVNTWGKTREVIHKRWNKRGETHKVKHAKGNTGGETYEVKHVRGNTRGETHKVRVSQNKQNLIYWLYFLIFSYLNMCRFRKYFCFWWSLKNDLAQGKLLLQRDFKNLMVGNGMPRVFQLFYVKIHSKVISMPKNWKNLGIPFPLP